MRKILSLAIAVMLLFNTCQATYAVTDPTDPRFLPPAKFNEFVTVANYSIGYGSWKTIKAKVTSAQSDLPGFIKAYKAAGLSNGPEDEAYIREMSSSIDFMKVHLVMSFEGYTGSKYKLDYMFPELDFASQSFDGVEMGSDNLGLISSGFTGAFENNTLKTVKVNGKVFKSPYFNTKYVQSKKPLIVEGDIYIAIGKGQISIHSLLLKCIEGEKQINMPLALSSKGNVMLFNKDYAYTYGNASVGTFKSPVKMKDASSDLLYEDAIAKGSLAYTYSYDSVTRMAIILDKVNYDDSVKSFSALAASIKNNIANREGEDGTVNLDMEKDKVLQTSGLDPDGNYYECLFVDKGSYYTKVSVTTYPVDGDACSYLLGSYSELKTLGK